MIEKGGAEREEGGCAELSVWIQGVEVLFSLSSSSSALQSALQFG